MADRFSDRFDESMYVNDPPVRVSNHNYGDRPSEVWVAERLWGRLLAIGNAYHLHYLPLVVAESTPRSFNSVQAEGVLEELEFVAAVVADPLLRSVISALTPVLASVARSGGKESLFVEGS